jgi:hypothetical protein
LNALAPRRSARSDSVRSCSASVGPVTSARMRSPRGGEHDADSSRPHPPSFASPPSTIRLATLHDSPRHPPRFTSPPSTIHLATLHDSPRHPRRFTSPPSTIHLATLHDSPRHPPRFTSPPSTIHLATLDDSPRHPRRFTSPPSTIHLANFESSPSYLDSLEIAREGCTFVTRGDRDRGPSGIAPMTHRLAMVNGGRSGGDANRPRSPPQAPRVGEVNDDGLKRPAPDHQEEVLSVITAAPGDGDGKHLESGSSPSRTTVPAAEIHERRAMPS